LQACHSRGLENPVSGSLIARPKSSADVGRPRRRCGASAGFHAEVREVLRACPTVHRWAILERAPLESWFGGGMVLLGDAAHPMTPYTARVQAVSQANSWMRQETDPAWCYGYDPWSAALNLSAA
jgi:salicylate hydroxylase/6-hydroxynicotinate 3-monooxygenase